MQNSAVTFLLYSFSLSYGCRSLNCLTANTTPSADLFIKRTDPPAPEPRILPNFPYLACKPWSSANGMLGVWAPFGGVVVPSLDPFECLSLCLWSPNLKNRFKFDLDPCDGFSAKVEELSSAPFPPPKMLDRLLSNACRLAPLALLLGKVGTVDADGRVTFAWPEFGKPCDGSLSPNRNLE